MRRGCKGEKGIEKCVQRSGWRERSRTGRKFRKRFGSENDRFLNPSSLPVLLLVDEWGAYRGEAYVRCGEVVLTCDDPLVRIKISPVAAGTDPRL